MLTWSLVLLAALADDKEVEEAIQKFKSAMNSPEVAVRAEAVAVLGRLQNERVMKALAACLTTDDRSVRMAAAKSLGNFREKKFQATLLLAEALTPNGREPDVQAEILGSMKSLREGASLGSAYRYIDDKNVKVAQAAIEVTGTVRSKYSVDPLIRLMKKLATAGDGYTSGNGSFDVPPDEALRERARKLQSAAAKALQSITGETFSTPAEWDGWWKRNSATFQVKE